MSLLKSLKTFFTVIAFLAVFIEDFPKFKVANAAYLYSEIKSRISPSADPKCLDLPTQGNRANGVRVQLWSCNGWSNQKWTYYNDGTLRNVWTHQRQCLDLPTQGNKANGVKVQVWSCNGWSNQKWTYYNDGTLRNNWSGQCLDLPTQANRANGTQIQVWSCNGGSNQKWDNTHLYS